jgi:hypothetical protein
MYSGISIRLTSSIVNIIQVQDFYFHLRIGFLKLGFVEAISPTGVEKGKTLPPLTHLTHDAEEPGISPADRQLGRAGRILLEKFTPLPIPTKYKYKYK